MSSKVPTNYICFKCNKRGDHWVMNCNGNENRIKTMRNIVNDCNDWNEKNRKPVPRTVSLLIYGYINECEDNNIYVPSSIKELILSFYPKPKDGILIIKSYQTVILEKESEYEFESIIICKYGTLTTNHWNGDNKKGGKLCINVLFDIILFDKGCINLNGKGYRGGVGINSGESINGTSYSSYSRRINIGGGGATCNGSGSASYGTKGSSQFMLIGNIYGDRKITILYLGSGGGGYQDTFNSNDFIGVGGNGGGALKICCNRLILKQDAYICCNGTAGSCVNCGCGSGGSMHLIIKNKFIMDKTSKIQAVGGKWNDEYFGGDGRIRLQILTANQANPQNMTCFNPEPFVG